MASNRTMSTEQIKRGLENIKKAQLEVLKQLRGDSFTGDSKLNNSQSMSNIRYNPSSYEYNANTTYKDQRDENRENIQVNGNRNNKSQVSTTQYEKSYENNRQYESSSITGNQRQLQSHQSNNKSIKTNESVTEASVTHQSYQTLRKQFSSERQQLKKQLFQITSKLHELEKDTSLKTQSRIRQLQLNQQLKKLQQEKKNLQQSLNTSKQQIQQFLKTQKKLKSQLQLKTKEKTILQTQIKSLKSQSTKQSRAIKELQNDISKYTHTIKELKEQALRTQQALIKTQQSRINMDVVIKEVKSISLTHDFMFNKLKESATIDMTVVEKESEIQNCFSRLLQYFEGLSSSSGSAGYVSVNNNGINSEEESRNYQNNKKSSANQSKELIKRSIISQSRAEEQEQLQYFVRQIGGTISRKQANQLMQQNEMLKRKLNELTQQRNNQSIIYRNNNDINNGRSNETTNKYHQQSKRLINLQLQDMRQQVAKFKKFKLQIKEDQQELEKQAIKHKLKAKELQAKLQSTQRKLNEISNLKFTLQKKNQQHSIEIIQLNSIIKQLNSKLYTNSQTDSPLTQLRTQFNKLLQTNSLLQRQLQSLKAMNQGLQAQIQTLKYENDQYQSNNKQKHELIQRQINQRNHLLQEINKSTQKHKNLQDEVQKLKSTILLNDQQAIKARKHYEDLLEQKNQQVLGLRKQIEELYKQSRDYHQLRFSFDKLQKQHKELARKSVKMGETLTHLWSVKQAEYHNINQVLGMFKNTEPFQAQNSAHF